MKKLYSLVMFLFITAAFTATHANAQSEVKKICFTDDFGHIYTFKDLTINEDNTGYAEGEADVQLGFLWIAKLWVDFSNGNQNGTAEFHAINPYGDNCNSGYTDSFVKTGSAFINRSGGVTTSYTGNGTWNSYCGASIVNSGYWTASGPCSATAAKPRSNDADIKSAAGFSIHIMPNPANSYAHVKYTLASAGKVNISIFNSMNQPVKVLVNESKSAGTYTVTWNTLSSGGTQVPAGLYKVVAVVDNKRYLGTLQIVR